MAVLNSSKENFLRYIVPVLAWAFLIFIVSSIPGTVIPRLFSREEILFHFSVYAVLGWLIVRALKNYYPGLQCLRCIYLAALLGLIYAVSDEFHQLFVPYRSASVLDVSVDGIGVVTGSLLFMNRVLDKINQLMPRLRKE